MSSGNESYDDEIYYDHLAEEWEARGSGGGGGGCASAKKKKKAAPTTVGRQRVGGTQSWGTTEKVCAKGCPKKCCSSVAKKTPSM